MQNLSTIHQQTSRATKDLPQWLIDSKQRSFLQLTEQGLPDKKNELYKYTNLGFLNDSKFSLAANTNAQLSDELQKYINSDFYHMVFVDGQFRQDLSQYSEISNQIEFTSWNHGLKNGQVKFWQDFWQSRPPTTYLEKLNWSLSAFGHFLNVPANIKLEKPIQIVYLTTSEANQTCQFPQLVVNLGKNSELTLVESYAAMEGSYWQNQATYISLANNAHLRHTRLQNESMSAYHFGTTKVDIARDGSYQSCSIDLGGKLSRHDLFVNLREQNAHTDLFGLYKTTTDQQSDHYSLIEHQVEHTTSQQLYKGILDDNSRAVFHGKIWVHPNACQSDSNQLNKNLLLSDKAKVYTHPTLLIDNDDVKCAHGATIGQIDEDQVFYLQSRAIDKERAQKMVAEAFAHDIILKIADNAVREWVERQWLSL